MNLHRVIICLCLLTGTLLFYDLFFKGIKNETIKTIIVNIRNLVVVLIFVELIFTVVIYYHYPARKNRPDYSNFKVEMDAKTIFEPDDLLSYRPVANKTTTLTTFYKGSPTNENIKYRIDSLNRRTFPGNQDSTRSRFAVFLGDSFTFSGYVHEDSTFSARFQNKKNEYTTYNYGVGGYGPQMMWLQTKTIIEPELLEEEQGIFVYLLAGDDHMDRLYGTFRTDFLWYEDHPWLGRENGSVAHKGRIRDKAGYNILKLLRLSNVVKYFNIKIPYKFGPKHLEFFADVINGTKENLKENFTDVRFLVVNYPTVTLDYQGFLDGEIEVIDLSHLRSQFVSDPSLRVKGDGHPTGKAYDIIATELANYLNK